MDQAWEELATPGSAVRYAPVVGHFTDCNTQPSEFLCNKSQVLTSKIFECKIINFSPISFNMCFRCSKNLLNETVLLSIHRIFG